MWPFAQHRRGEAPVAAGIRGDRAHQHPVVIEGDGRVRLRRAAQGWRGVIGGFPVGQVARHRADVIVDVSDNRRVRDRGDRGNHGGGDTRVTGLIGSKDNQ